MNRAAGVLSAAMLGALVLTAEVHGEVSPKPGPGDPHLQSLDYQADEVVSLRVALGYALTLELAPDERIETVLVGDASVWQVTASRRGDHLFVKPMQGARPTNMTVITDSRRYHFNLAAAEMLEPDLPYTVRFAYPASAAPASPPATPPAPMAVYRLGGDRAVRPERMHDDGRFTFIAWPAAASLPAIFVVGPDGQEALVNGALRDGSYVVEAVAERFVFRRGEAVATATRRSPGRS